MPHQTFFNLPEEKRQQILQVAIDEFAENDYDNVSISRIVARAGIAKGSFYQYFADKEDLYGHVLGLLAQAKTEFMSLDHPDPNHVGIFAYLHWTAKVSVAFQLAHPQLSKIAVRATRANYFPRGFSRSMRQQSQDFYRRLVEVGQAQGDIAAGIDPAVAAVIFDGALTGISNYLFEKIASGEIALKLEGDDIFNMPEVMRIFSTAVDLLEHGMGANSQNRIQRPAHSAATPVALVAGAEGD